MPPKHPNRLFQNKTPSNRLRQLSSIAEAEALGSVEFFTHIGLLVFGGVAGGIVFGMWSPLLVVMVHISVLTLEKWTAKRVVKAQRASLYWPVLGLLFIRASTFSAICVHVWTFDGDVFKFVTTALLVAATINIFVYHATHSEIIVAVFVPVWIGYLVITALAFIEFGLAVEPFMFLLTACCILPYFLLALKSAQERWTKNDIIQQSFNHTQKLDALGHLVAGVAHDFNNILTVTRGNAELLSGTVGQAQDELVNEIVKASDRGAALAGQLLAFGRRSMLSPEPIQIEPFFEDIQTLLQRVLPENIQLVFSVAPDVPTVFVDKHQLETALVNLATNARDAITGAGRIDITAEAIAFDGSDLGQTETNLAPGEYVMISVADDGAGIPDDLQESIFDPFFTTKPVGKGSGLGLPMVIGFAEQSSGGVRLESNVGYGTRVTLFFPVMQDASGNDPDSR
ncbi:sensor histidine kinase [Roseobacter sp. CCS2]|uniref:sensor histidine kinase n=1 Tax=Roseobacter sp. CCS2 TaxID=391593 RepID=UPI0000F40185|nr:ATP-binding protein [Roseobacter sp. CCS2]EBA13284.1 two-component hybrid sensor and regulator [Roseobacter sp. CCS2]